MTDDDFKTFTAMLKTVAEYFGRPLTSGVIGIYWQGLRDLDLEALRAALNSHVQNPDVGQFMPKIADIRRMVSGSTQDSALVAWSKVDRAIRQVGTYADVVFDDPIIHRVLHDMGGWVQIGGKSEDEWPFVAREFENRYRGYRMRGETPPYQPIMIGIAGAHNRKSGHKVDAPRLVGEPSKCNRVLLGGTDQPLLEITSAAAHVQQAGQRQLTAA